jgi:hypothetical protein
MATLPVPIIIALPFFLLVIVVVVVIAGRVVGKVGVLTHTNAAAPAHAPDATLEPWPGLTVSPAPSGLGAALPLQERAQVQNLFHFSTDKP